MPHFIPGQSNPVRPKGGEDLRLAIRFRRRLDRCIVVPVALLATVSDWDFRDVAGLVRRFPKMAFFPADRDRDLMHVPLIAHLVLLTARSSGES